MKCPRWIDIREDHFDDDAVMTRRLRAVCKACGMEIFAKDLSELIEEMVEHVVSEINAIKWGLMHLNYLTSSKLKEMIKNDGSLGREGH